MKVLIACEFSGTVRDAFANKGHTAVSCDTLPSEKPGNHHQGDIREILDEDWDLIIAHPPCTYLCNSGVRWLKTNESRWQDLDRGAAFFNLFLNHKCPRVCIENPIPHKYAIQRFTDNQEYTQLIQPHQFGHGETKAICLWLKGLPKLIPTDIVEGREARVHRMAPGPNRQKERSRFYTGIAEAMAEQWG